MAELQMINRWWRVVGGLSMNVGLGVVHVGSVFARPLEQEFGWDRVQVSGGPSLLFFWPALILAGRLQDKRGPFWISLIGGVLASLGFFMCAWTTSLI